MLVCMGQNYVVPVAPQSLGEPLLAAWPPAFPAADHHHGIGFQYPTDCFGQIPAKVHLNVGFNRLLPCQGQELFFCELHGNRRRFECQRVWNHLRYVEP